MHMWTDDEDFVIAASAEDAIAVTGVDMRLYPDDKPFTLFHDAEPITKLAREWAAEQGRGYFASTNY